MTYIKSALLSFFLFIGNAAHAAQPEPWALGFQPSASPIQEQVVEFHNLLLWIISIIVLLVLALIIYVSLRFNKKTNKKPSTVSHNTLIEVIWTAIPLIILVIIIIPSFGLLYKMDRTPDPEMTLKITGYQWYWGYEYPDYDGISFLSYMKKDDELLEGELRLLATDTMVVLPVQTNIQLLVTSADVIHSFAMPAFGVKKDAVPGRINETWVRINEPGIYYGQCSEICGKDHAYMPIMIKAVTKEEFDAWVVTAKEEYATYDQPIKNLAINYTTTDIIQ